MSAQAPSPRLLAPAPPSSIEYSESGITTPGPNSVGNAVGIKRASTACQSCKQIKRKCDQAQPCSNCRKSHTPCVYNESEDGRRKAARKRTVESLELKRDALESILESLRTSDDYHVQKLLDLIRSQGSLEEIVQYATSHAESLPGNQLHRIAKVVNGYPRKTVLSVNDLCDTPLVRVPSSPWTDVTSDDEFVSHLISIYFTWFHIAYPVLDKELFLWDMANGRLDCQFCSPLLVNAILTIACHFSDHPRVCKVLGDSSTRGRHFLEEATALWNKQEGRPSLLNIQAVSILAVSSTLVGKDRLSWSYVEQMGRMQQELLFKNAQAETRGIQSISEAFKRSQEITAWTTFNLTVGYGSAFMQPAMTTSPPNRRSMSPRILDESITWFPYPQRSPEVKIHFDDLHQAYCSLHEIGLEIQKIHFGDESTKEKQGLKSLDDRLRGWKDQLSRSLQLGDDTAIVNPPIMDLHLTYYWFRITLFNFIKSPESKIDSSLGVSGSSQYYARSQTIESAGAIAKLFEQYARDFGLKQPTIWMPQTAVSAAHSLIEALADPVYGLHVQDIFHELCLVIVAASQRWLVMKGHVRMLLMTAEERGKPLQEKTRNLLKFVALEKWGEKDHLQFASASYPNYTLAKDDDPRLAAMGDLLEKWATFRAKEEDEAEGIKHTYSSPTIPQTSRATTEDTEQSPSTLSSRSKSKSFDLPR